MREYLITPYDLGNEVYPVIFGDRERIVSTVCVSGNSIAELLERLEAGLIRRKPSDVLFHLCCPSEPRITPDEIKSVMDLIEKHCAGHILKNLSTWTGNDFHIDMLCFR